MSDVDLEPAQPSATPTHERDFWTWWPVRMLLVLGALAFLGLAQHRYENWQLRYASTFQGHLELWVQWVLLAVASGVVFGLAAWPPSWDRYRWKVALALGLLPLLLLLHVMTFWVQSIFKHLPGFLQREYSWWGLGPQFSLAIMLGVAIATGFAPRTEGSGSTTTGGLGVP